MLKVFLFGVVMLGSFYTSKTLAAGYACDTYKQYTSCNPGYYMNENSICSECQNGYYCPGDGTQYLCPKYFQSGTKLTSQDDCRAWAEPGYFLSMGTTRQNGEIIDRHVNSFQCEGNNYCPGGEFDFTYKDLMEINEPTTFGLVPCGGFKYIKGNGAKSADECIPCPEIDGGAMHGARLRIAGCIYDSDLNAPNTAVTYVYSEYPLTEDIFLSEDGAIPGTNKTLAELFHEDTNFMIAMIWELYNGSFEENPDYDPTKGNHMVVAISNPDIGGYDIMGISGTCPVGLAPTPGSDIDGIMADSVPAAVDALCIPIDDGLYCGDFGAGYVQCAYCSTTHPMLLHSDGERSTLSDCYALTKPGYYISSDSATLSMQEILCIAGDYCPGNITARIGEVSGNFACSALPGDNTVSPENATSEPGATKSTDCYVNMGDSTPQTDNTGTYIIGDAVCHYTE